MTLDVRSMHEWLLVALRRGRFTRGGLVRPQDRPAWHEAGPAPRVG
jgi:hypothetical protein